MNNVTLKTGWLRWGDLEMLFEIERPDRVFYAALTTWWTWDRADLYRKPGSPIPCDPRGSVLMEGEPAVFMAQVCEQRHQYGKHGLEALAAAFHGNIVVRSGPNAGNPTSVETWDLVNELIDRESAR